MSRSQAVQPRFWIGIKTCAGARVGVIICLLLSTKKGDNTPRSSSVRIIESTIEFHFEHLFDPTFRRREDSI